MMHGVFTKGLSLGLLSSFLVILALPGKPNTAYAADDPAAAQSSSLEIPGSFKELTDAKDAVTGKRLPGQIDDVPQTTDVQLEIDTEKVTGPRIEPSSLPDGEMLDFHATAYCLKGRTASGSLVAPGMIAADPRVLPLGTVVHLRAGSYTGIYTVTDTGGSIKGHRVDVYVPTYKEAIQFGRRQVKLKVIGRGSVKADRPARSLEATLR
ncbi:MAG TPA: 3D domain-containing protein [Blastocatellia bacterium]|nr:3D domain-containing protein [Blastocatellia bacterium]